MNYIDITQSSQTLDINTNSDSNVGDADFSIYKDGSDTLIIQHSSDITYHNYYSSIDFDEEVLVVLKDETQYSIELVDTVNNKVIYRGKFQTTSKDINNLSINEGQYIKKTTATNYTILD
jgi:hypothetical protein|tara:strand:- start:241 stop:600 length:360 start_codon:yes stop_codon:yes gene_type:complete